MTNILVVSDSHRSIQPLRTLMELFKGQAQRVVHLGDYAEDMVSLRAEFPGYTCDTVPGNCDGGLTGEDDGRLLHVHGVRILLTHGHRHNVKMSTDRLVYYAMEREADAVLFGHTHAPALFEVGRILFMNPGSVAFPRAGHSAGYGLLRVDDSGAVRGKLLSLTR